MNTRAEASRTVPFPESFGTLLRRYRRGRELTQEALAERAGLGVRSISDMERDVPHAPRKDTVRLLAEALALEPAERATFEAAARQLGRLPDAAALPPVPALGRVAQGATVPGLSAALGESVPPAQATGENRVLTVLFAELSGSPPRTARLPPEEGAAVIDQVLTAMEAAVHTYEGTVNRLLGSGLLAFFGTPVAHENDPERAILAAQALRAAIQALGGSVTVGITTGVVYLGAIGTEQHRTITAQGPVVMLAARLRETAQPGQILVGESVYQHTRGAFTFVGQQVQNQEGTQPVRAYTVVRRLPRATKQRGIEGLRAPLIGRDDEMARLQRALAAARAAQGQMATLIGDAGVGKSRLIAELKEAALGTSLPTPLSPDSTQSVPHAAPLWLEGRCMDVGVAAAYGPFLDMLRTLLALSPEQDEHTRGARIAAAVSTLVAQGGLPPVRAEEMLPVLGYLLSARFGSALDDRLQTAGPEQLKKEAFLTLRDLLLALAWCQPVVLILEDLHWADSLSLDLVALLMETLAGAPLFLVCAYRPERAHRCRYLATVAARKCPERYSELALRELSPPQSRRLVESLLHVEAVPSAVKDQILSRAQGNPFFLEEIVRALIEGGLLYHDGTAWQARAEMTLWAVPETVQSVILSRVDRLDEPLKHVVRSAAVIGRLFPRRLLDEVVRLSEGAAADTPPVLQRVLADLEERQLIYQERAIPDDEYAFQHALTQETIYHTILRRHRVALHGQVAAAMERLYADNLAEAYGQLAYHYDQAGAVEKAVEYQLKAVEKAWHSYQFTEALSYVQSALAHLEGSPVGEAHRDWMLTALHRLGMLARFEGKLADAEGYLRRALALGQELQQPARTRAQIYYILGDVLFHQNRGAEEVQLGEEGLALLGDDTECMEAALMNHLIAYGYGLQGTPDQGHIYALRNVPLLMTLPYSDYWNMLVLSVPTLIDAKEIEQASAALQHAESVSRQHPEDLGLAGTILWMLHFLRTAIGDYQGAVTHLQVALTHTARTDSLGERFTWDLLADCYLALGDLSRAVEAAGRSNNKRRQLAVMALCAGALDRAITVLDADRAAVDTPLWVPQLPQVVLGRAYLAQGRCEEAAGQFEEALVGVSALRVEPAPTSVIVLNALSGLEEAVGSAVRVRRQVERLRRAHPLAALLPRVPCLETTTVLPMPPRPDHTEFTAPLSPLWTWHDPFGDCSFALEEGLRITAANGRDLWHVNLSAPRLLRPAPAGDFIVQTLGGQRAAAQPAIGGLLLWQDTAHYLVLEWGHWGAADIAFRGCLDNADRVLGRGRLASEQVWLRLERQGGTVRALCSTDGTAWFTAGDVEFPAREGEQVGVHAIGMIDRTIYHGAYPGGTAIGFTSFDLAAVDLS